MGAGASVRHPDLVALESGIPLHPAIVREHLPRLDLAGVFSIFASLARILLLPGLQTVYVDPDSIRREGNLVTLWQLIDFKWMQGNSRGPHRFFSTKTHKQFDCAEERLRLLAFTQFSHRMGTGIPADGYVDQGNWIPVEPESINQALWEMACGKE